MDNIYSLLIIGVWITIVVSCAGICRRFFPDKKELSRKIVHIGTGPVIPLAWWFEISREIAIIAASVITIVLLLNNQFRFLPSFEDINRKSFGTIFYGLSITLLLIFLWPNDAAAVSAGVLAMAFGDGLAGLIGQLFKSPSWLILEQRKSIAGTLTMACVVFSILLAIMLISHTTITTSQLILITIIAVILEQFGPWGVDNITVPISVACSWKLMASI